MLIAVVPHFVMKASAMGRGKAKDDTIDWIYSEGEKQ